MDTEYAWAAGFLDGEGTLTIKRYVRYGRIVYQPYVSCSQANNVNHFQAIQKLKELFGGSISSYHPKHPRVGVNQWMVASQKAIRCVEKIYPFLKVKHKHAEILLSYYEITSSNRVKGFYRIPEEEMAIRESLWKSIRLLNEKGALRLQRLSEITP